jgi:hypothetical protein
MNGDGAVDVSDVFYLIDFLFTGGPADYDAAVDLQKIVAVLVKVRGQ